MLTRGCLSSLHDAVTGYIDFLNSAETKFFNCVNSHWFGIQGEVVHLKSCLCDMLLMPLIRLEKRRRRTSSTACKCQSGWKTGQLEKKISVLEK